MLKEHAKRRLKRGISREKQTRSIVLTLGLIILPIVGMTAPERNTPSLTPHASPYAFTPAKAFRQGYTLQTHVQTILEARAYRTKGH